MIIIALIFHKIGHYLPVWIHKESLKDFRTRLDWKRFFFEMNGVIVNFVMAFAVILAITLTTKEKYLLNENAIYGIVVSESARNIGFENGDKIISINGKSVDLFSEIITTIVTEGGTVNVVVQRSDSLKTINVSDSEKLSLMRDNSADHFLPKLQPDSVTDYSRNYLTFSEKSQTFNDAVSAYLLSFKMISAPFLTSQSSYNGIGGFVTIGKVKGGKGYLFVFAISLILLGLINLIPLPGLDMGNTIIALIEKIRQRAFNYKILRVVRIICSGMIVAAFIFLTYFR